MRLHTLVGWALVVAALAGCSDDSDEGADDASGAGGGAGASGASGASGAGGGAAKKPGWTVLLYAAADNNLEGDMMEDVLEFAQAGSSEGVTFLVQADRAEGFLEGDVGGLGDWKGAKRLALEGGRLREVADLGEIDSGSAEALADFVAWGLAEGPRERVAVVLSNHGNLNYFAGDDQSGKHMSLEGVRGALAQGLGAAGRPKLDLVVFDACLMGSWETVSTLKPYADYLVASEEVVPGHGQDYRAFAKLVEAPETSPVDLGRHLLSTFRAYSEERGTADKITLSLYDLGKAGELDAAVGRLAGKLGGSDLTAAGPIVGAQFQRSVRFSDTLDRRASTHLVDLGHFAQNLGGVAAMGFGGEASDVAKAVAGVVVDTVIGRAYEGATGLAIYLPRPGYYTPSYDGLAAAEGWRGWLKSYGASAGQVQVRPAFAEGAALSIAPIEGNEMEVRAPLAPSVYKLVTEATLLYGLRDEGTGDFVYLGALEADVSESEVKGVWDGNFVLLTDGTTKAPALHAVSRVGSGLLKLEVPLLYVRPDADERDLMLVTLLYDGATGAAVGDAEFLINTKGGWASVDVAAVQPGPYEPLALVRPAAGGDFQLAPTGPRLVFDDPTVLDSIGTFLTFEPTPAGGEAVVGLQIYDYADNFAELADSLGR
ncbi:MAG TPA: clostripain-related cysteine peptidase [Polyangiaceae bacterium]|nr:clostripain-related cysteine peptidase [Polyangiaceae bacterium]